MGGDRSFRVAGADGAELLAVAKQLQHLHTFFELHTAIHAGALQCPHQLAAVVDLPVLAEQQPCGPDRREPRQLPDQLVAIQRFPEGRRGVAIPFGAAAEGHHDARGPQSTGQAAVGLNLGHPARHPLQAALPQPQQAAFEPFGMGSQHAGSNEARGFAAPAAQHRDPLAPARQLVGDGQAHQATPQNMNRSCHRLAVHIGSVDRSSLASRQFRRAAGRGGWAPG